MFSIEFRFNFDWMELFASKELFEKEYLFLKDSPLKVGVIKMTPYGRRGSKILQ